MESLPPEVRREILRHLDLNDLARCGRVSHAMREEVDEVLSTIRCICHREEGLSDDPWYRPYAFAWLNSAPKKTMILTEFRQTNVRSFLQFITKNCPRISTLVASKYSVCLEDIAALAPRLNYFSLYEIKKRSGAEGTINAKTMVANFTRLQCYDLINKKDNNGSERCHHVVAREYCLLGSHQFAQCDEDCPRHISCHKIVKYRAMQSLLSLYADMPLSFYELHPSSFNSLKVLSVRALIFVPDNSPHFPNLLVVELLSDENLSGMIRLLHSSPRLLAAKFCGVLDQESLLAIDSLLSACSTLQAFHYAPSANLNLPLSTSVYSLDFTRLKCIRSFTWYHFNIPLKLTFPPHCHQIVFDWRSVSFNIDRRTYAFHPSSILANSMSPFHHPVELVISHEIDTQLIVPSLMQLCPQMSLKLSFKSRADCHNLMILILPAALNLTNVSEITLVSRDKKERIYKSNLETFFTRVGDYPDRSFSITLRGKISCNLRSVIKAQLNRKFIISGDKSKSPPETLVKISPLSNVSPPTNTE